VAGRIAHDDDGLLDAGFIAPRALHGQIDTGQDVLGNVASAGDLARQGIDRGDDVGARRRELKVDEKGFVLEYPDLWYAESRT